MSIEARLAACEARLAALESRASAPANGATAAGAVASDEELDDRFGDEVVKKDPPRWDGVSHAGCKMSECPPDYLRACAGFYEWCAGKDEESGKTYVSKKGETLPTAPLSRRRASLARGWARRNANGPKVAAVVADDDDTSLPF